MLVDDAPGKPCPAARRNIGIVISTRVRLARNLAGRKFPTHPDGSDRLEILSDIKRVVGTLPGGDAFAWRNIDEESPLECRLLVERHLISRELAEGSGPRAVALNPERSLGMMINEEDHLRLQCLMPGLALHEAYARTDRLDNQLSERLEFAFDPFYGYLTSCPTNVGTGLRVSAMLHLPALAMTRHIEKVYRAIIEMRMAVRGFYGEGTEAYGELYQISNQATCGKNEADIIDDMDAAIAAIVRYEERARARLAASERRQLEDRIWRSWGALRHARLMNTEEAMRHLSSLRMGLAMGLFTDIRPSELDRLFLYSQPAHLQRLEGRELEPGDRDAARAALFRKSLGGEMN
ncbi:MAG: protein arginine kinase [Planctomycetota bacterium]|jgi:protein arginine kinase|nr:protein arginine kinase [Planctomycetota bacterium]